MEKNNGEDVAQVVDSASPARHSRSPSLDRDQSRSPSPDKKSPGVDINDVKSRSASPLAEDVDE